MSTRPRTFFAAEARVFRLRQHMQTPLPFDPGTEAFPPLTSILVEGRDGATFLNGQFTCDVTVLPDGHWQWGGYCSPKGRLLATFRIGRLADTWVLQLPATLATDFVTRLRRFVLRAKVTFTELGTRCAAGRAPSAPAAGKIRRVGDHCVWGLGEGRAAVDMPPDPAPTTSPFPEWSVDIALGAPWILSATAEAFVPQMVDLDRQGGVSFSKGCYPGQEVVARARYLGEVKRHLLRLTLPTGTPAAPGDTVSGADDRPVGTVLLADQGNASADVLAVVDLEASRNQALRVGPAGVILAVRVAQDD